VSKRGRDQALDVDLPNPLRSGPGEQGMLLDERQSVLDRGLMGPFDHGCHGRVGHRPQGRDRLHRGERQVVTRHCLCPRPRVFRDLSRQLPSIDRVPAVLGPEKLTGYLGPHLRPICRRQRRVGRQASCRIDSRDAFGHFEPERADDTIEDLERSSEPGRVLKVPQGEVGSFQLLLAQLGQRVQTGAEQRSHLLSGHRVADGKSVDPVQAGTGPHPRASHPVRCSKTPARCDLSRLRPRQRPAGSGSHTQIPL
jgi:hypothetical protein